MRFIKKLYSIFPLKKELFLILRATRIIPHTFYKHLYFKGIFKVPVENKSFLMHHYGFELENEIFWKGIAKSWEKNSLTIWMKLSKEADVIIDIGANTGVYSLVASALNTRATIYALEPVARVFAKLKANVELNNFNIKCACLAASNKNGKAKIYDLPTEHIYSVTVNRNLHDPSINTKEIEIDTITLDTLTKKYSLPKIDLIKIDVETHEPEVLEGYKEYIAIHKPSLIVEVLNNEVAVRITEILEGLDYLFFDIDENSGIVQTDSVAKGAGYNYLICTLSVAKSLGLAD